MKKLLIIFAIIASGWLISFADLMDTDLFDSDDPFDIEGLTMVAWVSLENFHIPYEGFSVVVADEKLSDFQLFVKNNKWWVFKDGREYETPFPVQNTGWHMITAVFKKSGGINLYYDDGTLSFKIQDTKYDFSSIDIAPCNLFKATINSAAVFTYETLVWPMEVSMMFTERKFIEELHRKPEIYIETPQNNQIFENRVITVKGSVKYYNRNTIDMFLNGIRRPVPLRDNRFNYEVVLDEGENEIIFVAKTPFTRAEKRIKVKYEPPSPIELWMELTWDKNRADIDLHVIEPDGCEVYYNHKRGHGELDRDDTDGYGPEHYTLLKIRKIPGQYKVFVHYYDEHGQREPVKCKLVILQKNRKIYEREFYLKRSGDVFNVEKTIEVR